MLIYIVSGANFDHMSGFALVAMLAVSLAILPEYISLGVRLCE